MELSNQLMIKDHNSENYDLCDIDSGIAVGDTTLPGPNQSAVYVWVMFELLLPSF